jgi:hypothetical protein
MDILVSVLGSRSFFGKTAQVLRLIGRNAKIAVRHGIVIHQGFVNYNITPMQAIKIYHLISSKIINQWAWKIAI